MKLFPKTKLGFLSVGFVIVMFLLFYLGSSLVSVYESVAAGETVLQDIYRRPGVAISMLSGFVAGIVSFIVGLFSIVFYKERSLLVYISIVIGALLIYLLIGEFVSPH